MLGSLLLMVLGGEKYVRRLFVQIVPSYEDSNSPCCLYGPIQEGYPDELWGWNQNTQLQLCYRVPLGSLAPPWLLRTPVSAFTSKGEENGTSAFVLTIQGNGITRMQKGIVGIQ